MHSFSGTRGSGLDKAPDCANPTCNTHMSECEAVTSLQADTPAPDLQHHPNQNLANDDLLSLPGNRDMFDREPDYVKKNKWDYDTPDLHVITALKADAFAFKLRYHADQAFIKQLIKGITEGFEIGYMGPECSKESPNLKSARDNPDVVSA